MPSTGPRCMRMFSGDSETVQPVGWVELLRNPSAAVEAAKIEAQLNTYASPGTKVEIVFPDEYEGSQLYDTIGAQSVLNGLHHMMETPAIVRKIFWASQNGYDAVISSNTFDPGVDGGRLAVEIPVIGLLRTSMHA